MQTSSLHLKCSFSSLAFAYLIIIPIIEYSSSTAAVSGDLIYCDKVLDSRTIRFDLVLASLSQTQHVQQDFYNIHSSEKSVLSNMKSCDITHDGGHTLRISLKNVTRVPHILLRKDEYYMSTRLRANGVTVSVRRDERESFKCQFLPTETVPFNGSNFAVFKCFSDAGIPRSANVIEIASIAHWTVNLAKLLYNDLVIMDNKTNDGKKEITISQNSGSQETYSATIQDIEQNGNEVNVTKGPLIGNDFSKSKVLKTKAPPEVSHAKWNFVRNDTSHEVVYTCDDGYYLTTTNGIAAYSSEKGDWTWVPECQRTWAVFIRENWQVIAIVTAVACLTIAIIALTVTISQRNTNRQTKRKTIPLQSAPFFLHDEDGDDEDGYMKTDDTMLRSNLHVREHIYDEIQENDANMRSTSRLPS